jgi:hypothetical protein
MATVRQNIIYHRLTDNEWQELMKDNPMIMPYCQAAVLARRASSKNGRSINVPAGANGENNGIFLAGGGQSSRQGIAHTASDGHGSINTAEGIAS